MMSKPWMTLLWAGILSGAIISPAWSVEYLALVIGNSKYDIGFLPGPENDAADIASTLKKVGFEVVNSNSMSNLTREQMKNTFADFMSRLDKNSFAVVYYSGHGLEDSGSNFLVPIDAKLNKPDLEDDLVPLEWVLKRLNQREAQTKIVILDACRNMPSGLKYKKSYPGGGLAEMTKLGPGTRVIYAASPDQAAIGAADGERNSVFTAALLKAFQESSDSFDNALHKAAEITMAQTGGKQIPWSTGTLGMAYKLPTPLSIAEVSTPNGETSGRSVSNTENVDSSCNAISQVVVNNGVAVWTKKCI